MKKISKILILTCAFTLCLPTTFSSSFHNNEQDSYYHSSIMPIAHASDNWEYLMTGSMFNALFPSEDVYIDMDEIYVESSTAYRVRLKAGRLVKTDRNGNRVDAGPNIVNVRFSKFNGDWVMKWGDFGTHRVNANKDHIRVFKLTYNLAYN